MIMKSTKFLYCKMKNLLKKFLKKKNKRTKSFKKYKIKYDFKSLKPKIIF